MKILDIDIDLKCLTKNEIKIAKYVSKNINTIILASTEELATELDMSTATISRFWKSIGFNSFKEFKNHVKDNINIGSPADKMKDIIQKVDDKDVTEEMIELAFINLNKTCQNLDLNLFNEAVDEIYSAKNIYIYASGAAVCLSSLLSFRLNRLGIMVKVLPISGHALFESLLNINSNDVVIIFGFSNVLPEQRVILSEEKKIGFKSILITDLYISELIDLSDIVLHVERGEIWEFHSMVTPILLVEALVVSIALKNEKRSMDKLDYLNKLRNTYKDYLPR